MNVLFVEYPKCTTCRRAKKWLDDHGVTYTDRHIVEDRPTAAELASWRELAAVPMRRLFNTSGTKYRELGVKAKLDTGMSDEEALELLATDGMLVKRPVLVVTGGDDAEKGTADGSAAGAATATDEPAPRACPVCGTAIFGFRSPAAWADALGIPESEA